MEPETTTATGMNKNLDVGELLVEDCTSFEGLSAKQIGKRTTANICSLYNALFELKKK
jgi:hypothetical protein